MNRQLQLLLLCAAMLTLLVGCRGIAPPKADLEKAKAYLAQAEEVNAETHSAVAYNGAKKYLSAGEKNIKWKKKKDASNKKAKDLLIKSQKYSKFAYNKSAPLQIQTLIDESEAALKKAKDVKAHLASKNDYDHADNTLKEAKGHLDSKEFKDSKIKAVKSKSLADMARKLTLEKKAKSKNAIEDAEARLKEIEN